ncbi:MAG: hypothetical protein ABJE66_03320 [Deltaproteobacteria bacterium]
MRRLCLALIVLVACKSHDDFPISTPGGAGDAGIDAGPCGLVTCASANATCGPVGDGCGNSIDCGACTSPDFCGGDGTPFACGGGTGSGACIARTCAAAGADCGKIADGCGGLTASCGTCPTGEVCGANGVANVCGVEACTGLCAQQNACTNQPHTTISGTITTPGHDDIATWGPPDPIYGALVYVPNGSEGPPRYGVSAFAPGVACESCESLVSGAPLVTTTTAVDGTFTIDNAPCGTSIPLVIQLGRWRRQITIPSVACCANTALTAAQTHLPRTRIGEPGDLRSDIPLMAVSTGDVDTMHCVLRKAGIADGEFTDPNGVGRIQMYKDNGAVVDGSTPAVSTLIDSAATLARYDLVLFECVGEQVAKTAAEQQRVITFANAGGRVFATHYSYVWLTNSDGNPGTNTGPKPFSQTASWLVNQAQAATATALVDQTLQGDVATQTRRIAFASWLKLVGASTTLGQIDLDTVRHDFDAVTPTPATASNTPAQRWLYATGSPFTAPLHYTFDTPVAYAPNPLPTTQCGRVLYSDFHVSNASSSGAIFPAECSAAPLTPQEKTLEFMLFDLASCIGPQIGACTPKTCAQLGVGCGPSGDGCDDNVVLECGGCANGEVCGQGGPNQCGIGICTPVTCADDNATCGSIGNGCGGLVYCGDCPDGASCGGDSVPNQCGTVLK